MDSGSSVHVVDMEVVFPKAAVKKPHPNSRGFKVADGSFVPDLGTATVPAKTQEGDPLNIEWKNAKVAMPILSTNKLSHGGNAVLYHEEGGSVINPKCCKKSDFIESGGVYFIKLFVPKRLRPDANADANGGQQGFARPGVAP